MSPVENQTNSPPITASANGAHHPCRQRGARRAIGRPHALPMRCQRRIGALPLARDDGVEVLAQPIEFAGTARRQTVASLEAQAEAEVHQLQHRQERARVLPKLARAGRRSARRCAPPGGRSRPATAPPSRRCCPMACSAPRRRGWRTARSAPDAAGRSARRRRAPSARMCGSAEWRVRAGRPDPAGCRCCAGGRAVAAAAPRPRSAG